MEAVADSASNGDPVASDLGGAWVFVAPQILRHKFFNKEKE